MSTNIFKNSWGYTMLHVTEEFDVNVLNESIIQCKLAICNNFLDQPRYNADICVHLSEENAKNIVHRDMSHIEKRMENEEILFFCNKHDFEYTFTIGQTIRVTTNHLSKANIGILSKIEDDSLILITTCQGEKIIYYDEISDIEEIITDSMNILIDYAMTLGAVYEDRPVEELEKCVEELREFHTIMESYLSLLISRKPGKEEGC